MTVQTQDSPTQQIRELLGRLIEQRGLYQQLQALSGQQVGCIRDGSAEDLLAVLSQRQAVIQALSRSNAEVAPYRERWSQVSQSADAQLREQIRQVLADIEQMLQAILDQDERDRTELQGMQQQLGMQLNQVGQAGRAIKAYGPPGSGPRPATFTDRQG